MTKQEYYNLICERVKDGTMPSYDDKRGSCVYRGITKEGKKLNCIAAIILPEGIQVQEGDFCDSPSNEEAFQRYVPAEMELYELKDCQRVHDRWASPGHWNPKTFFSELNALSFFQGLDFSKSKEFTDDHR